VLRDFDVSGFSIFGTLGTDSRRYTFDADVDPIDIGLRLDDVLDEGLQSERVRVDSVEARRSKLEEHGATAEEIEFLATPDDDGMCQRIELNAMTSPQLLAFVERKLQEHGADKVVPESEVMDQHARRLIEQRLTKKALAELHNDIAKQAANAELPEDLRDKVENLLMQRSELSWDQALGQILGL
jgi:hypothetical protein